MKIKVGSIDELMDGQIPGAIKIQHREWALVRYFIPYYKTKRGGWIGPDELGEDCLYGGLNYSDRSWYIYQPSKPKVKRWLYALKKEGDTWFVATGFYTEEEAKDLLGAEAKRLDYSETDFDD